MTNVLLVVVVAPQSLVTVNEKAQFPGLVQEIDGANALVEEEGVPPEKSQA